MNIEIPNDFIVSVVKKQVSKEIYKIVETQINTFEVRKMVVQGLNENVKKTIKEQIDENIKDNNFSDMLDIPKIEQSIVDKVSGSLIKRLQRNNDNL